VELGGEVLWGMDLKAEVLASVEDFHEKRETRGAMGGEGLAEEVGSVLGPEVVQREADERLGSTGDDALSFLTIHQVPGFAIGS
jgi:hypothetical protein